MPSHTVTTSIVQLESLIHASARHTVRRESYYKRTGSETAGNVKQKGRSQKLSSRRVGVPEIRGKQWILHVQSRTKM